MTATATEAKPDAAPEEAKGGKKKLIVIVLLVAVIGGAGYWFFLKPKGPEPAPKPGEVVALDPIQVNLADGHYLSIGIALQQVEGAAHEAEGSKALDAVIELFSGRTIEELIKTKTREELKEELSHEIAELYHEEVMGVYYTQFVTQ
ncbi:MAG TPA: flagellar basal body-associated FliL family protein [Nocardioides sp.]|uniref:flagellar basal body-associated FliL family protein n=1 Tax=uncultured Nocardioides sp. TaxID=198441 RepID=UPI000EE27315|nr:flagellar basal body-associated FliL family protein [uncultured Nocardioides sp.]HCB04024.1 flagellar basal body-associated protein FliL [Nocardioides sp.]HRD63587.1 flagellar basal body-associated FliL family protein [Nocardioides sp.]HRI96377.1 flagellar basal body-associated FliL family protein [Nocardioides sp.]HRK48133.1 flagellar basal body-associated FliL family protein [Nocardioides sp.]